MKPLYRFREEEARAPRRKPTSISELLIKSLPLLFISLHSRIHFFPAEKHHNNEENEILCLIVPTTPTK